MYRNNNKIQCSISSEKFSDRENEDRSLWSLHQDEESNCLWAPSPAGLRKRGSWATWTLSHMPLLASHLRKPSCLICHSQMRQPVFRERGNGRAHDTCFTYWCSPEPWRMRKEAGGLAGAEAPSCRHLSVVLDVQAPSLAQALLSCATKDSWDSNNPSWAWPTHPIPTLTHTHLPRKIILLNHFLNISCMLASIA